MKNRQPKDVHQEMILENSTAEAPRCMKQVENAKYNEKKREQTHDGSSKRGNFADHIYHLDNIVHSHDFVQGVFHTKGKVPTVIL